MCAPTGCLHALQRDKCSLIGIVLLRQSDHGGVNCIEARASPAGYGSACAALVAIADCCRLMCACQLLHCCLPVSRPCPCMMLIFVGVDTVTRQVQRNRTLTRPQHWCDRACEFVGLEFSCMYERKLQVAFRVCGVRDRADCCQGFWMEWQHAGLHAACHFRA